MNCKVASGNKLKVLHVLGTNATFDNRPHVQVYLRTQIESLVRQGKECRVCVLRGRGLMKYVLGWFQIRREIKAYRPDLIHAHFAYCGLPSLGHGLPLVTSFLGSDVFGFPRPNGSYPPISRMFHRLISRFVASQSAQAIVKSSGMNQALGMKLHVIPNGVDLDIFRPVSDTEKRQIRCELGLNENGVYIVFVGDPKQPVKRFLLATEAVRLVCDTLERPIELLGLHGIQQGEVARYMQACNMLLLTSAHEGSPNVVKEAMATNLPIVSVDVGDVSQRIDGVIGYRVCRDDRPETIAASICALLSSKEQAAGRSRVENLGLDRVAAQVVSVYEEALRV